MNLNKAESPEQTIIKPLGINNTKKANMDSNITLQKFNQTKLKNSLESKEVYKELYYSCHDFYQRLLRILLENFAQKMTKEWTKNEEISRLLQPPSIPRVIEEQKKEEFLGKVEETYLIERYNQYIKPYLNKSQNINLEAVAVDYYYKDSIHGTTTETEISIPNNVMKNKIDEINSKNSQESFVKNKDPYINFSNSYHENTMSPKNNPNKDFNKIKNSMKNNNSNTFRSNKSNNNYNQNLSNNILDNKGNFKSMHDFSSQNISIENNVVNVHYKLNSSNGQNVPEKEFVVNENFQKEIEILNQQFLTIGKQMQEERTNIMWARNNLEVNNNEWNNCLVEMSTEVRSLQQYFNKKAKDSKETIEELQNKVEMLDLEKEYMTNQYNELVEEKETKITEINKENLYLSGMYEKLQKHVQAISFKAQNDQDSCAHSQRSHKSLGFMQQFNKKFKKDKNQGENSFHNELVRLSVQQTPQSDMNEAEMTNQIENLEESIEQIDFDKDKLYKDMKELKVRFYK